MCLLPRRKRKGRWGKAKDLNVTPVDLTVFAKENLIRYEAPPSWRNAHSDKLNKSVILDFYLADSV
jgi:hypothetical protein